MARPRFAKWELVNLNEPWIANGETSGAAYTLPPDYIYECSNCGYSGDDRYFREKPSFDKCPCCGLKMRNAAPMKCRYDHNGICVNQECPVCADKCPTREDAGVCRYEERGHYIG